MNRGEHQISISSDFELLENNHISIFSNNSNNTDKFELWVIFKEILNFDQYEFLEILYTHSFKSFKIQLNWARRLVIFVIWGCIHFELDSFSLVWTINKFTLMIIDFWNGNVYKSVIWGERVIKLALILNVVFLHVKLIELRICLKSSCLDVEIRKIFFNFKLLIIWSHPNYILNSTFCRNC